MAGSGFEIIFRVTNNCELVAKVEGDMATLAACCVKLKNEPTLFGKLPHPLDELVAFHGLNYRAILPECQEEDEKLRVN